MKTAPREDQEPRDTTTRWPLAPSAIVGGVGGLLFVASVVVQNVIRAGLPAVDADPQKIIDFYAGNRGAQFVLGPLFAIGAIGIALFCGALAARLNGQATRAPLVGGILGVVGVIAMFSLVEVSDFALGEYVRRGAPAPDVVSGLWLLHAAAFGVLAVFLGVALSGLSSAAAEGGLVSDRWKPIGLVAAILLAVAGAATPAVIGGTRLDVLALVGFLVWLVFLAQSSVQLLRRR